MTLKNSRTYTQEKTTFIFFVNNTGVMMMMPQTRDIDSWESWWWCPKQETWTHESHDDDASNKRLGLMKVMMIMPQTRDKDLWEPWWWCHKQETWTHEIHDDDATKKIHGLMRTIMMMPQTRYMNWNKGWPAYIPHVEKHKMYSVCYFGNIKVEKITMAGMQYICCFKRNVQCFWIN